MRTLASDWMFQPSYYNVFLVHMRIEKGSSPRESIGTKLIHLEPVPIQNKDAASNLKIESVDFCKTFITLTSTRVTRIGNTYVLATLQEQLDWGWLVGRLAPSLLTQDPAFIAENEVRLSLQFELSIQHEPRRGAGRNPPMSWRKRRRYDYQCRQEKHEA